MQADRESSRTDEPGHSAMKPRRLFRTTYPVVRYPEGKWRPGPSSFMSDIPDDRILFTLAAKKRILGLRQNSVDSEIDLRHKNNTWRLVSLVSSENIV